MKTAVVIPAGGKGSRFGGDLPIQFVELNGKPLIIRTIEVFNNIEEVESIILAINSEWFTYTKELVAKYNLSKPIDVVVAGMERQDSIYNALRSKYIQDSELVLIHDANRPFLSEDHIRKMIESAEENGAVVCGFRPNDPVKEINQKGQVVKSLQREKLSITQTPQAFWTDLIVNAYENAREVSYSGSDSSQLVEFNGFKVTVIPGEDQNIKINTQFDFKVAELILNQS